VQAIKTKPEYATYLGSRPDRREHQQARVGKARSVLAPRTLHDFHDERRPSDGETEQEKLAARPNQHADRVARSDGSPRGEELPPRERRERGPVEGILR
jgi:hypothetical protein